MASSPTRAPPRTRWAGAVSRLGGPYVRGHPGGGRGGGCLCGRQVHLGSLGLGTSAPAAGRRRAQQLAAEQQPEVITAASWQEDGHSVGSCVACPLLPAPLPRALASLLHPTSCRQPSPDTSPCSGFVRCSCARSPPLRARMRTHTRLPTGYVISDICLPPRHSKGPYTHAPHASHPPPPLQHPPLFFSPKATRAAVRRPFPSLC